MGFHVQEESIAVFWGFVQSHRCCFQDLGCPPRHFNLTSQKEFIKSKSYRNYDPRFLAWVLEKIDFKMV